MNARETLDAARQKWDALQAQLTLPLNDPNEVEGPRAIRPTTSPAPSQGITGRRES